MYPTDPAGIEAEIARQTRQHGSYDSRLYMLRFEAESAQLARLAAALRTVQARRVHAELNVAPAGDRPPVR